MSEEYFLKVFKFFSKKILVISPDFKILATNDLSEKHKYKDTKNILGKFCYEAICNKVYPCKKCIVCEVKKTLKPALLDIKKFPSLELDNILCSYAYPVFKNIKGLRNEQELEAIVIMDFEFPELIEGLEEQIQRSNSFLKNLILSCVDGVIAADKKGKILMFNDAAAELSGYKNCDEFYIWDVYPEKKKFAREIMQKLRSDDFGGKGKLKSYQIDVIGKDKEIMPINLNAAIVYENNQEVATIGFFHDLREELKLKAQLEKTQLQLLQAEKMASLGKLAAGVAHQLNNPLSGITLYTKLILEENTLSEDIVKDLNRILTDAQRCRDTVKELLEFARQTQYKITLNDINQAIARTLFLLENQVLFQNIIIEKSFDQNLPKVPSDIQQLNHMFMNIILNAAEAMEGNGKITVKTSLLKQHNQDSEQIKDNQEIKNKVIIEIADTGPGIPEETLKHIFEPFFTTKEAGKGTGLGLSLVYSIVENHGGNIKAESEIGKGTKFTIVLPILPYEQT